MQRGNSEQEELEQARKSNVRKLFNMFIQLTAWAYTMNSIQQETNNVVIVPQYNKSCSKMNYIWQP